MSWDRIVSLIGTMAAVIACVCSVLSLIKMKKSSIDPTKIFRGVIVLVTVAAVALVTGIIVSWITTVSAVIVAVCSILILIKISKNPIDQDGTVRKRDRLLGTVVLVMFAIVIMLLFLNNLPVILSKVIREEGDIIALITEVAISKDIREANEKIVVTLTDSQAVCKFVYREALERTRAGKCAYIDRINGRYFLPENWKEDNEPVLLTAEEKSIIQNCFTTHENKTEDLCVLIFLVLNDERMITELTRPGAYDIEYYEVNRLQDNNTTIALGEKTKMLGTIPIVTKKTLRHITPYEKIAIIGAYIDEQRR